MADTVSVVITTSAREPVSETVEAIDSVRQQSCLPKEIILVVEGEEPDSERCRRVDSKLVRVLRSDGFGLSEGRNTGIRNATEEIVAFIDDDALADKNWLHNLIRNYDDPRVMGAGGKILAVFPDKRPLWFAHELDWMLGCTYAGHPQRRCQIRNLIGSNMSFRREALLSIGGFPTRLGRRRGSLLGSEEAALAIGLLERYPESRIIFDPEAVVYHRISRWKTTLSFMIRRSFFEGYSKAIVARLFGEKALWVEARYVRMVLGGATWRRFARRFTRSALIEWGGLMCSTYAVGLGYVAGWLCNDDVGCSGGFEAHDSPAGNERSEFD